LSFSYFYVYDYQLEHLYPRPETTGNRTKRLANGWLAGLSGSSSRGTHHGRCSCRTHSQSNRLREPIALKIRFIFDPSDFRVTGVFCKLNQLIIMFLQSDTDVTYVLSYQRSRQAFFQPYFSCSRMTKFLSKVCTEHLVRLVFQNMLELQISTPPYSFV